MTKDTEIKLLDATIAKFGTDSYLGPWLKEIRHDLVADINNDLTPNAPMPSEAHRKAQDCIETARAHAKREIELAQAEAQKIIDSARKDANDIRQSAKARLQELAARF